MMMTTRSPRCVSAIEEFSTPENINGKKSQDGSGEEVAAVGDTISAAVPPPHNIDVARRVTQ